MKVFKPENYRISEHTYFLKSHIVDDRNHTFAMEEYGSYDCPKSITRILRSSCRLNGISLERVRAQSKRFFTEKCNKQPLILAYDNNIPVVFFPIYSYRNTSNILINCNHVIGIEPSEQNETTITFTNFYQLQLPVRFSAFSSLYVRAIFYQRHLRKELPTSPTIHS